MPLFRESVCAIILLLPAAVSAAPLQEVHQLLDQKVLPLLETSCIDCHDADLQKGDINLDPLFTQDPARLDIRFWLKVREQLRAGTMPPAGKTPLPDEARQTILSWIAQNEQALLAAPAGAPGPARTRRLNREEYSNSLRDLFGINQRPGDKFPSDGSGGEGFNNNADTLTISPLLIEKYLGAANETLETVWSEPHLRNRLLAPVYSDKLDPVLGADLALRPFLLRAYRQIPDQATLDQHLHVFRAALQRGYDWDGALRAMFKSVLISPRFLFLEEAAAADGKPRPLNDFELASRLSFFLWSSIPDDPLLSLAAAGRLNRLETLAAEIRRMLADPKADALVKNFAGQWLRFEDIPNAVNPDRRKFAAFDGKLRQSMYDEMFHFSRHLLLRNGRALDFLDSDYSFINERLAAIYGIPDIKGEELRPVKFTDKRRGGVTTMSGMLALTSYPQRTSPVLRGKWILEQLLGTSPPPPPPNVGGLPEDDKAFKEGTLRQRLEAHRSKPACSGCHARLDPPGFALENFNPIGQWRDDENGKPLDATGTMAGQPFATPDEFRQRLLEDKNLFVRNFTTKLLGYALGRGLEVADQPALLRLEQTLISHDYHIEPLLIAIVQSHPFLWRR